MTGNGEATVTIELVMTGGWFIHCCYIHIRKVPMMWIHRDDFQELSGTIILTGMLHDCERYLSVVFGWEYVGIFDFAAKQT